MKRYLLLLVLLSACGGSSDPLRSPAEASAVTGNAAGAWRGTATTTSVFQGECLGPIVGSLVGTTAPMSATVTQTGSSVSATAISPTSGASCSYSGTMGQTALVLTGTSCTASDLIGARCANGALRDVKWQTAAVNATVIGPGMNGTLSDTYNVFVAGTTQGVGTLTINTGFSLTKQ